VLQGDQGVVASPLKAALLAPRVPRADGTIGSFSGLLLMSWTGVSPRPVMRIIFRFLKACLFHYVRRASESLEMTCCSPFLELGRFPLSLPVCSVCSLPPNYPITLSYTSLHPLQVSILCEHDIRMTTYAQLCAYESTHTRVFIRH